MVGVKTEGRGAINAQIRFNRNEGSGGNHGRPIWRSNTLCSRLESEGHAIRKIHGIDGGINVPAGGEDEILRRGIETNRIFYPIGTSVAAPVRSAGFTAAQAPKRLPRVTSARLSHHAG